MAKVIVNPIASGYASNSALNANFNSLAAAIENTVSRDGSTPNTMSADLDLNGKSIINVKLINSISATDLSSSVEAAALSASNSLASANASEASALASQASAVASAASASNSAVSAISSATSAAAASVFSTLGLGGVVYDLGYVSDPIITFPTDWGTLA